MSQSQLVNPTSSSQDLSHSTTNSAVQSTDPVTWSATTQLNRRPSLSQYSNRYERHAKDGFAYWPTDTEYKKPRCKLFPIESMTHSRLFFRQTNDNWNL